jgi:hypothetical protein
LYSLTSPSATASPKPVTWLLLRVRSETFWPVMPVCTPPEPPLPVTRRWSSVTPAAFERLMPRAALLKSGVSAFETAPLVPFGRDDPKSPS